MKFYFSGTIDLSYNKAFENGCWYKDWIFRVNLIYMYDFDFEII